MAEPYPSGAIPDLEGGLPNTMRGRLTASIQANQLADEEWTDTRSNLRIGIGLGRSLALHLGASSRDLAGKGAFQKGTEDTRIGLSFWPVRNPNGILEFGVRGDVLLPTGFRTQESYYDSSSGMVKQLPAFSLGQNAGEMTGGMALHPSPAAEMNVFASYLSTSDRKEQAFRWGVAAWIAPFGPRVAGEIAYGQSFTRIGSLPHSQVMSSGLAMQLPLGFTVVPQFTADLSETPDYGAGLSLRFTAPLPHSMFPVKEDAAASIRKFSGAILIPPPIADIPIGDKQDLWSALREEVGAAFESIHDLASLDLPGYPFDNQSEEKFWQSMRGISMNNPGARWILVSEVVREEVSCKNGFTIPLILTAPVWQSRCDLRVRLVDMLSLSVESDRRISGNATRKCALRLTMLSSTQDDLLSSVEARKLTFAAYRNAGRNAAIDLAGDNSAYDPEDYLSAKETGQSLTK